MKEPFRKIRNVYGERFEEAPQKGKRKPLSNFVEIFTYNKLRNDVNNRNTLIFNTLLITGVSVFLAFLILYMTGTLEFMV
ncbi:hypothetical protein FNH22_17730 [Fulvivirga sp. M361]|uniref:hypothetical protein n=1 Tax=Fulvivirga sp. M361 TaxID=2594266 RepID=UPI00117AB0FC|nr:hypothetical protein [Fulvivirga sp. M361]TRX56002.1 hypothetical protein FNH22_17730 [Fulvivirga sp. M361]